MFEDNRTPLEHAEDTISHMGSAINEIWEALNTALMVVDELSEVLSETEHDDIKEILADYGLESARDTHRAYDPDPAVDQTKYRDGDGTIYSVNE
jgi:hypothetical protein